MLDTKKQKKNHVIYSQSCHEIAAVNLEMILKEMLISYLKVESVNLINVIVSTGKNLHLNI